MQKVPLAYAEKLTDSGKERQKGVMNDSMKMYPMGSLNYLRRRRQRSDAIATAHAAAAKSATGEKCIERCYVIKAERKKVRFQL